MQWLLVIVQLLNYVWLFATPWTTPCQASLSFTISQSFWKTIALTIQAFVGKVMSPLFTTFPRFDSFCDLPIKSFNIILPLTDPPFQSPGNQRLHSSLTIFTQPWLLCRAPTCLQASLLRALHRVSLEPQSLWGRSFQPCFGDEVARAEAVSRNDGIGHCLLLASDT